MKKLTDGFEQEAVPFFSEADFTIILERVEYFGIGIYGIEPWLNGELYDVITNENLKRKRQTHVGIIKHIGLSPKEYSNIIRFQNALSIIKNSKQERSLLDIAFECGYYDHSHLSNEIKRNTGLSPSLL